jgi:hypothetical protein
MRMLIRLAALALLALPSAGKAQEMVLNPDAIFPAVDTLYTVAGPTHADTTAVSIQSLRRVMRDGVETWEMAFGWKGVRRQMADTTFFSARTLAPIAQHRVAEQHRIDLRFDGPVVRSSRLQSGTDAPVEREFRFEQPVYAGSMMDIVYRALPLAEGFRTRIPFFIPEQGKIFWFDVQVAGAEDVQVRGREMAAWRVEALVEGYLDTLWISRESRQLLKVESGDGSWIIR